MRFTLSLEQQMIRDTARDFLAVRSDSAAVRRVVDAVAGTAQDGHDTALWREMAGELGWCGIALPEAAGGAGLGAVELALLMEQMGQRLACVPYWSAICLAAPALAGSLAPEAAAPWLARLAQGEARAALALPGWMAPGADGLLDADALTVTAAAAGDGFVLDGQVAQVFDAAGADWLLVPARLSGGAAGQPALFLLQTAALAGQPGFGLRRLAVLDRTRPLADLVFDGLRVEAKACLAQGAGVAAGMGAAMWHGSLMLAAEQLGGAQQCLDLTVAYAAERIQFGRPIAAFQAVKHRCAQMMVAVEAARSAVHGAARAWQAGAAGGAAGGTIDAARLDVAAARLAAGDAFGFCAQEAIQLHGGVGFTWEYDPQLYFKRAQAAGGWLGGAAAALARIADGLLAA